MTAQDLRPNFEHYQPKIFISYSRVDENITIQLHKLLEKPFDNVWRDPELKGGEQFWLKIEEQIGKCDIFVFVMSDNSLGSQWCQKELERARRENKRIIPIKVQDIIVEIPQWLNELQWVLMLEPEIQATRLSDLYAAINHAPIDIREKYALTPDAKQWAKKLVGYWTNGEIEQSFIIMKSLAMMNKVYLNYSYGVLSDTLRTSEEKPPIAILKELASVHLIQMVSKPSDRSTESWEITLLEQLKQAVALDFRK